MDSFLLILFGALSLLSASAMLFLREPMRVALCLIATMVGLSAIYGLLGIHFLAAFQVLIYVGAVMVFMVYVIMLLEARESAGRPRFSPQLWHGALAFVMLLSVLGAAVWGGETAGADGARPESESAYGLTEFSVTFLQEYWLEFELTTVLLVAAIVAALAMIKVNRRTHG